MRPAAMPVFCGIISLYILVAGILVLPILRSVENHSLAANYSPALTTSADAEYVRAMNEPAEPKNQFIAKVHSANENSPGCRRVKVILADYLFSDVQTKSCMGKVYQFVATRRGQNFFIEFNALTGEFVKVAKILPSKGDLASERKLTGGNHYAEPISYFPNRLSEPTQPPQ